MKDTMRPFRQAVHTVLNAAITYKGSTIKFFDEKVFTGQSPDLYGMYGTQRETDTTQTDCSWECKAWLDIILVNKTGSETSKEPLDDISDDIYELLLNLPGSHNLPTQSGFQITNLKRESAVCGMIQISPTETQLQKIITLTATIIQ